MDDRIYNIGYTNAYGHYNEFRITFVGPSSEFGNGYFEAECIDDYGETEGKRRTFKDERVDYMNESDKEIISRYAYRKKKSQSRRSRYW